MRVGIIGAGTMGAIHAAAWRSTGAQLAGCFSARKPQCDQLAELHKTQSFSRYDDLLEQVEIVDICTPTATHKSMVLKAARAGKHVLCEKPVALREEDANEMIETCEKAGVRFFVGMVVRFFPQYRLAKNLVNEGTIGKVTVLRLRRVSYPPQKSTDNWYLDEDCSGGMIVDLMIHDFDFARWLAGDVQRVFARRGRGNDGASQYCQTILRFKSGAIGLIEGGWAYPAGVFRTGFDLSGTDGLIEWSSDQPDPISIFRPREFDLPDPVGLPDSGLSDDPYALEIRHAYDAIRTARPFDVTAGDALQSLRIALAARASLATNLPVVL
jgi:myo-inositol 2-dehydrogenase/D-chiro-inositol 1-dehydrogenase